LLVAAGIGHAYRRNAPILRSVVFTFSGPGLLVIGGASGSGKTTLLGILGGIMEPSLGEALYDDVPVSTCWPTWVFQNPNVLSRRSSVDNVALGGVGRGVAWLALTDIAMHALHRYGLGHVAQRPAGLLSGGEVQRLVLARAELSCSPFVLIDEPTAQLDHDNSLLVADALVRLAAAGATVVVATHDSAVAQRADATVSIVNGEAAYVEHS